MNHTSLPPNPAIFQQIGNTPLVDIKINQKFNDIGNETGITGIWCKLEFFNPSGSVKDRIARNILQTAWREGKLNQNTPVIEASSGSTSIALALACSHMGLKFHAVLPAGASHERRWTIEASGGDIETTSIEAGMDGARALELVKEKNGFYADQFNNKNNFLAHEATAREILDDIPTNNIDALVCGVGTGGTLVGIYKYCVSRHFPIKPYVARLKPGAKILHDIGFTCQNFNCLFKQELEQNQTFKEAVQYIDIDEQTAISWTDELWKRGFPVGPASGVNFAAAVEVAKLQEKGKNIVTIFTDRMERYFSTQLFDAIKLKSEKRVSEQQRRLLKEEIKREILNEISHLLPNKG